MSSEDGANLDYFRDTNRHSRLVVKPIQSYLGYQKYWVTNTFNAQKQELQGGGGGE